MFAKFLTAATLSLATLAAAAPMPAMAQGWSNAPYARNDTGRYENGRYDAGRYDDRQSGYGAVGYRGRDDRGRGRYGRGGRYDRAQQGYRGNQRCYDKGNGGLAIGGIAGGLLGNQVAGRGDRTLGTVLGAGVGALAGRAVDRSDGRRC